MYSNKNLLIMSFILVVIFGLVITSYFKPTFFCAGIITHLNTSSSFIIMILTLFYVITTNLQLHVMNKQINLMNDNTNMQVQPIPIPVIKNMALEKIRPLTSPEHRFMKIIAMSRFFCDFQFKNVGNGAALNVAIFPFIVIDSVKIPIPSMRPELTYCVSNEILDQSDIEIMMFDKGIEIAKAIFNRNASLELNILYKNVFNVGFHELISYTLYLQDNPKDWEAFFNNNRNELIKKIEKHNAIKPIDSEDADKMFQEIEIDFDKLFPNDLDVMYKVKSKSYTITIVDYAKSIKNMEIENEKNYKNVFKEFYEFMMALKERKQLETTLAHKK